MNNKSIALLYKILVNVQKPKDILSTITQGKQKQHILRHDLLEFSEC